MTDLMNLRYIREVDDILKSAGKAESWSWYAPKRKGGFLDERLDRIKEDVTGDIEKDFANDYELIWQKLDTLRAIYLAQDSEGRCNIINSSVEFAARNRNSYHYAAAIIGEFLIRYVQGPHWEGFVSIQTSGRCDEWSVTALTWLRLKLKCDHELLDEANLRLAIAIAKQAHVPADKNLQQFDIPILRIGIPGRGPHEIAKEVKQLADACEQAALNALAERHHSAYVSGITWEINQDRERAADTLKVLGIPDQHIQPLRELDELFRNASTGFKQATFIAACRAAFEPLMKELANQAQALDPKTRKKPPGASANDALHYLQTHQILHERERQLLSALYDCASDAGSHSNMADPERARIMKNFLIEAVLLVATRFKAFSEKHKATNTQEPF